MRSLDGVNCLLLTPFDETGQVDEDSQRRLIDHVLHGGVTGLVAMNRIGEGEFLTMEERRRTMKVVVDHVGGRVPVGAGIIDASFEDGLTIGRIAREAGGDFVMSRPPIDGDLSEYYLKLADIIPVMVYDRGQQQGELSIEDDILPLTRKTPNIVALKISGHPDKVLEAKRFLDIPVLCAWDSQSFLGYRMGSDGVVGAYCNHFPRDEVRIHELVREKRWEEAREIVNGKVVPLFNYCTRDPYAYSANKYVAYYLGLIATPVSRNPDAGMLRREEILSVLRRSGAEVVVDTP